MRRSRIHVDIDWQPGTSVSLPIEKAHYIKNVLRLKNDQSILIFNGRDNCDYLATITINGKQVSAKLISVEEKQTESPIDIKILQAAGRSEHMDYVVQKSTELGVSTIQFFNAERTQSPIRAARIDKKLKHWQAIAISACEQCNRNRIPQLSFLNNLQSALHSVSSPNRLMLDFDGQPFKQVKQKFDPAQGFTLLIGAEGGMTPQEIELAQSQGFKSCVLGPRVMRMETAASAIVTMVQHDFGDLG